MDRMEEAAAALNAPPEDLHRRLFALEARLASVESLGLVALGVMCMAGGLAALRRYRTADFSTIVVDRVLLKAPRSAGRATAGGARPTVAQLFAHPGGEAELRLWAGRVTLFKRDGTVGVSLTVDDAAAAAAAAPQAAAAASALAPSAAALHGVNTRAVGAAPVVAQEAAPAKPVRMTERQRMIAEFEAAAEAGAPLDPAAGARMAGTRPNAFTPPSEGAAGSSGGSGAEGVADEAAKARAAQLK